MKGPDKIRAFLFYKKVLRNTDDNKASKKIPDILNPTNKKNGY
jgi:hypothetical protein